MTGTEKSTLPVGVKRLRLDLAVIFRRTTKVGAEPQIDANFRSPRAPGILRIIRLHISVAGIRIRQIGARLLQYLKGFSVPIHDKDRLTAPGRSRSENFSWSELGDINGNGRPQGAGFRAGEP